MRDLSVTARTEAEAISKVFTRFSGDWAEWPGGERRKRGAEAKGLEILRETT